MVDRTPIFILGSSVVRIVIIKVNPMREVYLKKVTKVYQEKIILCGKVELLNTIVAT